MRTYPLTGGTVTDPSALCGAAAGPAISKLTRKLTHKSTGERRTFDPAMSVYTALGPRRARIWFRDPAAQQAAKEIWDACIVMATDPVARKGARWTRRGLSAEEQRQRLPESEILRVMAVYLNAMQNVLDGPLRWLSDFFNEGRVTAAELDQFWAHQNTTFPDLDFSMTASDRRTYKSLRGGPDETTLREYRYVDPDTARSSSGMVWLGRIG